MEQAVAQHQGSMAPEMVDKLHPDYKTPDDTQET